MAPAPRDAASVIWQALGVGGMTGTAETELTEFNNIYELQVQVVPTNQEVGPGRKRCSCLPNGRVLLNGAWVYNSSK